MAGAISEQAAQGLKFGPAADDYERGRPGYPPAAIDLAATALGLSEHAAVLEVGAGTGKLTRLLTERFGQVAAVEPLPELRAIGERTAAAAQWHGGTAERLPVPDESVRAVFVAEAFHWFDGPAALAEATRVLAPGGGIVLLWNTPTGPTEPALPEAARELARAAIARGGEPGGPLLERGGWRQAFGHSGFGPLREGHADHEVVRDRDDLIADLMSVSSVAGLPADERVALRDRLRELIPEQQYRRPLRTDLAWASTLPVRWCPHCGEPVEGGLAASDRPATVNPGGQRAAHPGCQAALALEPPRYCRYCRRRMKVQVLPAGWSARCVEHGEQRGR